MAKVSQGFDSITANNDLTIKITSKSLSTIPSHKLFELLVMDSFHHSKEFEVTQVLKGVDQDHAFIIASSLEQRSKMMRFSLTIEGELIAPTPTRTKLTAEEIAKRNFLVLIEKNLNKGIAPE